MLKQLVRFECFYQIKQPSFIILLLVAFAYGIAINANVIGQGMDFIDINSPYRLSYFIGLTSVFSILIAMTFCVSTLLRDQEYGFNNIIAPLAVKERFISQTLVILLSTLCVTTIVSVGLMLGMLSPTLDSEKVAEFSFIFYLWPWLIFVLPNTVIGTLLLVTVTLKKRTASATYVCAIFMFVLFWLAMIFIKAPLTGETVIKDSSIVSFFALLDPFGTSAFFEQSKFWTLTQKNQQLFSFSGSLLLNRMLWLVISFASFIYIKKIVTQHLTSEASVFYSRKSKLKTKVKECAEQGPKALKNPIAMASELVSSNRLDKETKNTSHLTANTNISSSLFQCRSVLTLARFEIKQLLSLWSFRASIVIICAMSIIGILMAVGVFSSGEFSGHYPTTSILIGYSTEAFSAIVTALVVLYSAEKIWQEKLLKADSLIDSTPISDFAIYSAKLLSLFFIPLLLIALNIVISLIFQVANGYYRFEISHYLSMFYFTAMPVLLSTVLIFFIQSRIASMRFSNKYLAMVVSGIMTMLFANTTGLFGLEHPLLNINQLPSLLRVHSEMPGYGDYGSKFHYLMAFWGLLAMIIAGVTVFKWNRGEWQKGKRHSLLSLVKMKKSVNQNKENTLSKGTAIYFTSSLIAFVALGSFIHMSMPANNDYQTQQQTLDHREVYETKYKQYQSLAIPQISQMTVVIDFFPENKSYSVKADYQLVNSTGEAMQQIFVTARSPLKNIEISHAEISLFEATPSWNVYLFTLEKPLLPGESLAMHYQLQQTSSSFSINPNITHNGSYINHSNFEPIMGYVERLEIRDEFERKNRHLIAKVAMVPDRNKPNSFNKLVTQKRTFEAILSTSAEQMAVTSGDLIKTWQQEGRNFFHYKMQQPIYPFVGYFSAMYKKESINHKGIAVDMYFHPEHQNNVAEMLRATRATLDYAIKNLGPYAFSNLRVLEVPAYHPFGGKAAAGVVALSESLYTENFNDGSSINNVARNTIHEVLHQWWGEKLVPKVTQGEGVLTESLTKYMEAVILGEMYGNNMARQLMKYNQRRYFSGRAYAIDPEIALIDANKEAYLNYGKGPVVFQALSELLGEIKLNDALKQLIENHKFTLSATTDDLLAVLLSIAKEQKTPLIQDWLTKVIEYDLAIENAVINGLNDGRYEVIIDVKALRLETNKSGDVSKIAINEPIKIALFSAHPDDKSTQTIYLKNHLINQANSKIKIITKDKPSFVMIDPNYTRLDRNLADNITKIGTTHNVH